MTYLLQEAVERCLREELIPRLLDIDENREIGLDSDALDDLKELLAHALTRAVRLTTEEMALVLGGAAWQVDPDDLGAMRFAHLLKEKLAELQTPTEETDE